MATDSAVKSVTNTLSTTVADEVTLTQAWPYIVITNHDATTPLYCRFDGTTAVSAADNNSTIRVSSQRTFPGSVNAAGQHVISIVGSGNIYTIEGSNTPPQVF